jgi:hypothetical protein
MNYKFYFRKKLRKNKLTECVKNFLIKKILDQIENKNKNKFQ